MTNHESVSVGPTPPPMILVPENFAVTPPRSPLLGPMQGFKDSIPSLRLSSSSGFHSVLSMGSLGGTEEQKGMSKFGYAHPAGATSMNFEKIQQEEEMTKIKRNSKSYTELAYGVYPGLVGGLFSITYRWIKKLFSNANFT